MLKIILFTTFTKLRKLATGIKIYETELWGFLATINHG